MLVYEEWLLQRSEIENINSLIGWFDQSEQPIYEEIAKTLLRLNVNPVPHLQIIIAERLLNLMPSISELNRS